MLGVWYWTEEALPIPSSPQRNSFHQFSTLIAPKIEQYKKNPLKICPKKC